MKYSFFLLVICTFVVAGQSNQNDDIVAKIGNKVITAKELKERFELTPRIKQKGRQGIDEVKEDLLYSIVAEKLWALEAENQGLDTTDIMRYTFPALEKMYIRDALYSKEIKNKIDIDPGKYTTGQKRSAYNVLTKFFHSLDKNEIDSLYHILQAGFTFDSLFNAFPQNSGNFYEVQYGKMEEFVEDSIYNTKIGSYTSPVKSPEGWYIFKIDTIRQNFYTDESLINTRDMNIRKTVEARATSDVYGEFYSGFFKDLTVNTDGELFWSFSNQVIKSIIYNSGISQEDEKAAGRIAIGEKDFTQMLEELGPDTLNMTFIKFPQNPVSLKEFMHDFFFEGFYTVSTNPDVIRAQLNSRVRYFIEREFLTREAINLRLDKQADVEFYRDMWRNNYMGTLYKRKLLNEVQVSDEEAFNVYSQNNESIIYPKRVNILEILTDSLEVIEEVFNKLDKGGDFRTLAKKHTKRSSMKERGGEFGLFPTTSFGEIGRIAGEMEVGEIYGPLKTGEGYSIFKLIDKTEVENNVPESFGEIKNELKNQIAANKLREKFIDRTAELAVKYGVNIDSNALKSINVTDLTMVVYRYMGFGGRLLAVPFTNTLIEWVDKWKSNTKSLP
jgi:parvulin-like peptidyl-prolyl isomerase